MAGVQLPHMVAVEKEVRLPWGVLATARYLQPHQFTDEFNVPNFLLPRGILPLARRD